MFFGPNTVPVAVWIVRRWTRSLLQSKKLKIGIRSTSSVSLGITDDFADLFQSNWGGVASSSELGNGGDSMECPYCGAIKGFCAEQCITCGQSREDMDILLAMSEQEFALEIEQYLREAAIEE